MKVVLIGVLLFAMACSGDTAVAPKPACVVVKVSPPDTTCWTKGRVR